LGRTVTRAVDRDDRWASVHDKLDNPGAAQTGLELRYPPVTDERDIEALALSTDASRTRRANSSLPLSCIPGRSHADTTALGHVLLDRP
jgi:hypothetical protein